MRMRIGIGTRGPGVGMSELAGQRQESVNRLDGPRLIWVVVYNMVCGSGCM